jgi:hypothetical protein
MGVFKDAPVHDWSSHAADAARTLAMGLREDQPMPAKKPPREPWDYPNPGDLQANWMRL